MVQNMADIRWTRKHLLSLEELSPDEITFVLDTAESLKEVSTRSVKKVPALRGRVVVNAFFGTVIAWLLVRDAFPGKGLLNAVIDLPFALPTIVASLILVQLYGDDSPIGVHLAATRAAVVVALLFVTLPFVVRAVQPLLSR